MVRLLLDRGASIDLQTDVHVPVPVPVTRVTLCGCCAKGCIAMMSIEHPTGQVRMAFNSGSEVDSSPVLGNNGAVLFVGSGNFVYSVATVPVLVPFRRLWN